MAVVVKEERNINMSGLESLSIVKLFISPAISFGKYIGRHWPHPLEKRKVKKFSLKFADTFLRFNTCFSQNNNHSFYRVLSNTFRMQDIYAQKILFELGIFERWYRHFKDILKFDGHSTKLEVLNMHISHLNMMLNLMNEFCREYHGVIKNCFDDNTMTLEGYNILKDRYNSFLLEYENYLRDFCKAFPNYSGHENAVFNRLR